MTFLSLIFIVVGILFLIIMVPRTFYYFKKQHDSLGKVQLEKLKQNNNFDAAHLVYGLNNSFLVAIDYDLGKIAYLEDDNHLLLDFDDIVAVDVLTGEEVAQLTVNSPIGQPALVGGNLLVGISNDNIYLEQNGVKELRKTINNSSSILLHLQLSLKHLPDLYINCFDSKDHTVSHSKRKESTYANGVELASKLESLFQYIIQRA